MRRLPALAVSCSFVTRSVHVFARAGAVAMLLAAVVLAAAAGPAAAETLPAVTPDIDDGAHEAPGDETFVIARAFACPTADADLGSCESLAGVTLSIVLDGNGLPNGPLVTAPNPIGSNSADFLASASQWLSITAIDGLPAGYAPAAGSDPFMALVSDLPFQGCGGESLCQYADLVAVPASDGEPIPSDPSDPSDPAAPQPVPVTPATSTVTIYSVLCPAGTAAGSLFETCYDSPAAGMPYRAGVPNTEFPETTTPTDAGGFVAFSVDGGVTRLIQELPFAATVAVYCTADGAETGVAIVDSGNPALGVADVTLTGGDVRCDWYTIPAGDAPPQPDGDATGDPAPAGEDTSGSGDVVITALPNTGTGPDGSPAMGSHTVWMLVLGVAGMVGALVARRIGPHSGAEAMNSRSRSRSVSGASHSR